MSLSNIDKTHLDKLLLNLNTSTNNTHNILELVKSNHAEYAQLKLIAKQMNMLRNEALDILNRSREQEQLHKIKTSFKLVSGNSYYLYEKYSNNNIEAQNTKEEFFSLVSPEEWGNDYFDKNNIKYVEKYYYDFDKHFVKVNDF